jgi:hypothetical protein
METLVRTTGYVRGPVHNPDGRGQNLWRDLHRTGVLTAHFFARNFGNLFFGSHARSQMARRFRCPWFIRKKLEPNTKRRPSPWTRLSAIDDDVGQVLLSGVDQNLGGLAPFIYQPPQGTRNHVA